MQKISKAQTHLRILLAGLESNPPPIWGQDYPYFWGKVLFEVILNSGAQLFKTYHPPLPKTLHCDIELFLNLKQNAQQK